MQYILLFLEGIITFISPCLLPLLPVYVSLFAAGDANRQKALVNALGFVLGFSLVFIVLGAFAGTLGHFFLEYTTAINIITGLIVIVFGLNFLGVIKIGFLNRTVQMGSPGKELNLPLSVLFGMVFSIGWTPCVGAFLGSALMMASQQGSVIQGILMLLVYSAGLGIPFVLSAVLIDRLKGAFDVIKKNYRIITIVSGCLLIAVGLLMATGLMGRALTLLAF
ncbi:MAG: cytochrome c biogenesis protein CcdA [Coriobacteriales bacterium]|nr:cytochrome c biogenesis protein CcdA [Coriobacteriales bacterium]